MTWTLTRELAYVCSVGVTLCRLHVYVKLQNMKRNYIINFCDRREGQTEELGVRFQGINQCQQATRSRKDQHGTEETMMEDETPKSMKLTLCVRKSAAVHDEEVT